MLSHNKYIINKNELCRQHIRQTQTGGNNAVIDEGEQQDRKEFAEACPGYEYLPTVLGPKRRIIVFGDIHGDYNMMIDSLKLGKVINDSLEWIGDDTVVVQVGDQVDLCRPEDGQCSDKDVIPEDEGSDILIMEFMTNLHKKAIKNGGAVFSLLGNHELMNVMGDLRYVSKKGLDQFDNYKDPENPNINFESGIQAREHAFKPGNEYAKFMACTRQSALIIGSFLFVHAGITDDFAKKNGLNDRTDLVNLNRAVRRWLLGKIKRENVESIVGSYQEQNSMFWVRILGNIQPGNERLCESMIDPILNLFKVGHMVIGHTPQFMYNKGINDACNGKVWRVDIGASKAFNKYDNKYKVKNEIMEIRDVQVLEILNDKEINIIKKR